MKKELKLPTILTYALLVVLLIYMVPKGNYEFIGYAVIVGLLYLILLKLAEKYDFPAYSVWLFVIWVYMHMLGGTVYIAGTKLYDLMLLNLFNGGGELVLLKYDQFVHFYCYFVISIFVYIIMKRHFISGHKATLAILAILAASGIGMLNEVIEFGMVLFAGAAEAVGGYYNTALDLVFNLIGAIAGVWFIAKREK